MEIKQCPHCGVRICATDDGRCPSCRRGGEERCEQQADDQPPIVNRPSLPSREDSLDPESASPYAGLARKIRPQGSPALTEHLATDPVVVVIRSTESVFTRNLFLATLNLFRFAVTSLPFNVVLDGNIVASLTAGERSETPVAPGEHRLWVSNALAASRAFKFTVGPGQRIRFACSGKTVGMMMRRIDY